MTKVLAENSNNDLFVQPNNQLGVFLDLDATVQLCKTVIETQRGELQYDTTRGIPTSSTLWAGVAEQSRFRFYCIEALRAVSGVQEILRFDTELVDDVLEYVAIIKTDFGTVEVRGLFNGV